MVTLELRQISVSPGQRLVLHHVNWEEFEAILQELGDRRPTRLAYYQQTLEIRMPLPEHEASQELIGDMVKILLEELEMDRECFGSTTFKREDMAAGIEPDNCFYIQNHQLMIGKTRLDLSIDPPPDLAIEIDLTSKTQLDIYAALGVPELWRYEKGRLKISLLQNGKYIDSAISATFPQLPVIVGIGQFLDLSKTTGMSPALRGFRKWIREQGIVNSGIDQ